MSQWNYFVTAQTPTAVTHAVGPICFTSSKPTDLVVARVGRLEFFCLSRCEGSERKLEAVLDVPVHARIAALQAFRPVGEQRDLLLLLTEKRQLAVLRFNIATGSVGTVAVANLQDPTGRPVDHVPLCACDPVGRVAAVYLYEGLLKFVPLNASLTQPSTPSSRPAPPVQLNKQGVVFSTRVAEPRVLDIAFLHSARGEDKPTLAVLHADGQNARFLAAWLVDLQARDLAPGPMERDVNSPLKPSSSKLAPVPLPLGGTLVLGGSSLAYHDDIGRRVAGVCGGPKDVAAVALVEEDGSRWILGGVDGSLWLLRLQVPAPSISGAAIAGSCPTLIAEFLGTATLPRALVHLNDGYVFVGSSHGDSQLLRLATTTARGSSDSCQFAVVDSWANLGPILDFCVADVDDRGQNQIVTCSGVGRTGSLRFVRIGIGVNEVGSLPGFDQVLGMWALGGIGSKSDNNTVALVFSFVGSTRVLAMKGDSQGSVMAEKAAPGFVSDEQTIFCCEASGVALQVTRGGVRAASLEALTPLAWWSPPPGTRALVATGVQNGLILTLSNSELVLLHAMTDATVGGALGLQVSASLRLLSEVACMCAHESLCAIGLWSRQLQILSLRGGNLTKMHSEGLPVETIPRSSVFAKLKGVLYLLVGMGDGRLLSFHVNESTGVLSQRRAVCLGAQPIRLLPFQGHQSDEHIFATGDRPIIIHANNPGVGQLSYAAVNLRQVNHVASFNTPSFPGCLAFVTEKRLVVGSFDEIQRIHVRTMPLGKSPHRISYQKQFNVFAVACHAEDASDAAVPTSSGSGPPASSGSSCLAPPPPDVQLNGPAIVFIHGHTLEVVQAIRFDVHEPVSAMTSAIFDGDPCEYLVVGTAVVNADEPEPLHGRVIVYANKLSPGAGGKCTFMPVCDIEVPGAVYALLPFQGALLGAVNNRVNLWKWVDSSLQCVCYYNHYIISLYLQTLGDYILVGDLMRSASLLRYKAEDAALIEVARDSGSAWLTSIAMLSEDIFLCTDDGHNIFTLQRTSDGSQPSPGAGHPSSPAHGSSAGARGPSQAPRGDGTLADMNSLRLEYAGQMHLGEFVNRMHRATLIQHPATDVDSGSKTTRSDVDDSARYSPVEQVVWASVDGAIGLIASLRGEQEFARLSLIQNAIAQEGCSSSLEGLGHGEWRDFWSEAQGLQPHKGFIDGNLLESMLEMPRPTLQKLVDRLRSQNVQFDGVPGLMREVEELARLH